MEGNLLVDSSAKTPVPPLLAGVTGKQRGDVVALSHCGWGVSINEAILSRFFHNLSRFWNFRRSLEGGRGSTLNLLHPILTAARGASLLWKAYESSALRHPLSERQSLLSHAKESVLLSCLRPWAPPATLHRLPTYSATGNCLSLGGLFRFSAFSLPLLGGQGRKILTVDTPL